MDSRSAPRGDNVGKQGTRTTWTQNLPTSPTASEGINWIKPRAGGGLELAPNYYLFQRETYMAAYLMESDSGGHATCLLPPISVQISLLLIIAAIISKNHLLLSPAHVYNKQLEVGNLKRKQEVNHIMMKVTSIKSNSAAKPINLLFWNLVTTAPNLTLTNALKTG